MGINISADVYETSELLEAIIQRAGSAPEGKIPPHEFLLMVLKEMGALAGTKAVIITNEYYDEYDPSWAFTSIIARYYGFPDEDWWEWIDGVPAVSVNGGANADEIAEELGIELADLED